MPIYEICFDLCTPTKERRFTAPEDADDWKVMKVEFAYDFDAMYFFADTCGALYYEEEEGYDGDPKTIRDIVDILDNIDVSSGDTAPIYCKRLDNGKYLYNSGITFEDFHGEGGY